MSDQDLIWASLEAAAESGDDLVPVVYAQLFAARPEVREIFAVEPDAPNPAMGSMINEIITLIADGIDAGTLDSTIMSTLINHLGWGIDLAMYQTLLDALTKAVRDASGAQWTDDMAAAWRRRVELVMDSLRATQVVIDGQQEYATHGAGSVH